jgi:hypothetical protein
MSRRVHGYHRHDDLHVDIDVHDHGPLIPRRRALLTPPDLSD